MARTVETAAPSIMPPTWVGKLTVGYEEIAEATGLGVRTVRRLAADGKIPGAVQVGARRLFRVADLLRWIERGMPTR